MSTTNFELNDPYLTRMSAANAGGAVMSDSGNCTGLGPSVDITNKASGGAIGTAAATVDVSAVALVNQTTAGQTLTLPDHTPDATGKFYTVLNVGSQAFTMLGISIAAGTGLAMIWSGSAWLPLASGTTTTTTTTTTP